MLVIRPEQMAALSDATADAYAARLAANLAASFPFQAERAGDGGMLALAQLALQRAKARRFTTDLEVRRFAALMVLLGAFFDEDPLYPWTRDILANPANLPPGRVMDALHDRAMAFLDAACGEENEHHLAALERLVQDPELLLPPPGNTAPASVLTVTAQLRRLHTARAHACGLEPLESLAMHAVARSADVGFTDTRSVAIVAALMFLLGAGVLEDPLHGWTGQALGEANDMDDKTGPLLTAACDYAAGALEILKQAAG